jgi:hypothetical protein
MRKVVSSVLHRGNFWLAYHNLRVEKIYSSALRPCHLGARSEHGAECFAFRALVAEQRIPAIETPPSEPPRASEKVEEEWERAQREPRAAVGEAYSRPGVGGCSADELLLISPLHSPPGLPGPSNWDSAVYLPNLLEGDFSEVPYPAFSAITSTAKFAPYSQKGSYNKKNVEKDAYDLKNCCKSIARR